METLKICLLPYHNYKNFTSSRKSSTNFFDKIRKKKHIEFFSLNQWLLFKLLDISKQSSFFCVCHFNIASKQYFSFTVAPGTQ